MSLRKCPHCGLTYVTDVDEDRIYHRSYHRSIVGMHKEVYEPKPLKSFLKCLKAPQFPEHKLPEQVRAFDPKWKQRQVFLRARAFKREFGYDSIQWDESGECDLNAYGFLLHEEDLILGACAFRWRENHWGMQWMWLAPKARRKGILTKWWPKFVSMFGDFHVEAPLSEAMESFVKKVGHRFDLINTGTVQAHRPMFQPAHGYVPRFGRGLP